MNLLSTKRQNKQTNKQTKNKQKKKQVKKCQNKSDIKQICTNISIPFNEMAREIQLWHI